MDGIDDTTLRPATRQPKKRFVGRRTADAQAQAESTNTDTSIEKGEPLTPQKQCITIILINFYSHPPQTPPNPKPHPPLHLRKPRHPRRHLPPALKLLLRNPQNDPSHPYTQRKTGRSTIPRGSVVVRNHNIRYPHRILRWRRDTHHGRRHVRRLLHRRLHSARTGLRSFGALCA